MGMDGHQAVGRPRRAAAARCSALLALGTKIPLGRASERVSLRLHVAPGPLAAVALHVRHRGQRPAGNPWENALGGTPPGAPGLN
jgi:hypothetical protein